MHNSFAAQSVGISLALLHTECDCFQMYHLFFRIKKCMSATGQASPHVSITNPPPSFLLAETHIFIENSWADFFPARSPAYFLPGFQIALSHVQAGLINLMCQIWCCRSGEEMFSFTWSHVPHTPQYHISLKSFHLSHRQLILKGVM